MTKKFVIDLREIEGDGEFSCPICRELISLGDESTMVYDIVEARTMEDGNLQEISIKNAEV